MRGAFTESVGRNAGVILARALGNQSGIAIENMALLERDTFDAAQKFQVRRTDARDHAEVWADELHELRHLADAVDAHLEHVRLVLTNHSGLHQSWPNHIEHVAGERVERVQVAWGFSSLERHGQKFFECRFARRSGDANDLCLGSFTPSPSPSSQRNRGIVDPNGSRHI